MDPFSQRSEPAAPLGKLKCVWIPRPDGGLECIWVPDWERAAEIPERAAGSAAA